MKSLKIALAALVGLVAVSCYNDFDTPAPQKLYTADDMAAMGLTRITIAEVKEKFGPISNTGTNDNFSTTKTLKFGTRTSEEAKFDGLMEWPEASKYYIKGQVISSDRQGNIYKSLYIYDDGEWDGCHDDERRDVAFELRHHQQVNQDQPHAIGGAHVAEGFVGDLRFAIPLDRVLAVGVGGLVNPILGQLT